MMGVTSFSSGPSPDLRFRESAGALWRVEESLVVTRLLLRCWTESGPVEANGLEGVALRSSGGVAP